MRRFAIVLAAVAWAPSAVRADDPFARELRSREARWARDAARPEGAIAVLGALELWDRVAPGRVAAFLEKAAARRGAHPLARAHARYLAAQAAARLGDAERARAHRRALGIVEAWRVSGPYPAEGDPLARSWPPERAAVENPSGDGSREPAADSARETVVTWRKVRPEWLEAGAVPLGAMLRPDADQVAYALAEVESDAAREVAVRVASTGPIQVWVNGTPVLRREVASRPLRFDQDSGRARFVAGKNVILVKTAVHDGPWAFLLRIADEPPEDLRTLLEARARRARGQARAAALGDLARFLAHVAPDDPAGAPVEAALRRAGLEGRTASPETLLLALRHAETTDVARRAAERLLAHPGATPTERAEAATALGAYYADEAGGQAGQWTRAQALFERALSLDPSYWPAELRLAQRMEELGLVETAWERLVRLAQAWPEAARVKWALAAAEKRRGRPEAAEAIFASLRAERRDDVGLVAHLAELARARGDDARAIALLGEIVAIRPASATAHATWAESLAERGRVADAVRAYDAGLEVAPDDTTLLEASGRLLVLRGDSAGRREGIARLKRALALRPQNPELRRWLGRHVPDADADLVRAYAKDPAQLAARWRTWRPPGAHATVLLDQRVTRVHDNGLSEAFVQRVVRIEDDEGAEAERTAEIPYSPETQSVEVRAARVHRAVGGGRFRVVSGATQDERELSEPWYGMYYDLRALVLTFGRLEPGDVVELSYVVADVGRRNLFSDDFGDLYFFGDGAPRAESEYVLLSPKGRTLYVRGPALAEVEQRVDDLGEERRWRFRATRVPKVDVEEGMPGWTEVLPFLHVSTWGDWREVARWYWGLIRDQLASDDAIRRAAREATRGLRDPLAKVRALHALVVQGTRYVALEFGIHGYKPYRAPLVFQRKFGDCKDKASLLTVLLREVGIEAHLALVRTRRLGEVGEEPPSLAVFDHAIAYVPSLDLWLDGTAEFSGTGELPHQDQGVMALVIDGADGVLRRTPVHPPDANRTTRTLRIELSPSGAARLVEDVTVRGQRAADWRRSFQTPGERRDRYEKQWNADFVGARVERVEMPGLEDLERPVRVHAEGVVPELGRSAGARRVVLALARTSELTQAWARASARRHDLLLPFPWVEEGEVVWVGVRSSALPETRVVESPFGRIEIRAERTNEGIVVRHLVRVERRRVPAKDYAAWRRFLVAADAALNQTMEIEW